MMGCCDRSEIFGCYCLETRRRFWRSSLLRPLWCFLTILLPGFAFSAHNPLVVVSFDGFRYDYVDHIYTPSLDALVVNGFRTKMIPAFPSLTFPNHFTLVTGMKPQHHGIVSNLMYDSELDRMFDKEHGKSIDEPVWYQAAPIWETVRENGLKSAVFFWFSSEVIGKTPNWFVPFRKNISYEARLKQLGEWLSPETAPTPDLMFFYISLLDGVGHSYGPHSVELIQAVSTADWLVDRFRQVIQASGRPVDFLIVSDHGMTTLKEDWVPTAEIQEVLGSQLKLLVNSYSHIDLFLENPTQANIERAFNRLPKREYLSWHMARDFPSGAHPSRNGDIIGLMDLGYEFRESGRGRVKGAHGYDVTHAHMAANIFGIGPSFRSGQALDQVRSIDVYPLLMHLMGLPPGSVDGALDVWTPVLTEKMNVKDGE